MGAPSSSPYRPAAPTKPIRPFGPRSVPLEQQTRITTVYGATTTPPSLRFPWQAPGGKPAGHRIHRRWENFRPVVSTPDAATVVMRESTPVIRRSLGFFFRTSRRAQLLRLRPGGQSAGFRLMVQLGSGERSPNTAPGIAWTGPHSLPHRATPSPACCFLVLHCQQEAESATLGQGGDRCGIRVP